ncbi:hypothetical protein BJ165DRAFT_1597422 [Panaeolus papilionaceus]|nr:hypothetical protein BJ165DRAFT_1597422 [Panaeolus papilionaceus]
MSCQAASTIVSLFSRGVAEERKSIVGVSGIVSFRLVDTGKAAQNALVVRVGDNEARNGFGNTDIWGVAFSWERRLGWMECYAPCGGRRVGCKEFSGGADDSGVDTSIRRRHEELDTHPTTTINTAQMEAGKGEEGSVTSRRMHDDNHREPGFGGCLFIIVCSVAPPRHVYRIARNGNVPSLFAPSPTVPGTTGRDVGGLDEVSMVYL